MKSECLHQFGLLTMAFHREKYLHQAVALARSVRLHNPHLPIAIVTNLESDLLNANFDQIIQYRDDYGDIFEQKLYLYDYSPFQETLYIDSDCLMYGSLESTIKYLSQHSFWMPGYNNSEDFNPYWGVEAADWCQRLGVATVPRFNAGVFYFAKCKLAEAVFFAARKAFDDYDDWGIKYVSGGRKSDEPCFSVGMARQGVQADEAGLSISTTFNGFEGAVSADVISGTNYCLHYGSYKKIQIMHYAGAWQRESSYLRERIKLRLVTMGVSVGVIYGLDALLYFLLGIKACLVRGGRKLLGRTKFPLSPLSVRH